MSAENYIGGNDTEYIPKFQQKSENNQLFRKKNRSRRHIVHNKI
jgi:hypothetical protein